MARKTTISREGLEFLIGSVKNTINIGDIINNEDLADNKTYSNIKIEERIDDKIDEKLANFDGDVDLTDVDNRITTLETQVSDLFQSVSNGKQLVASAITDKGVDTLADATFETMAENISNITAGDLSAIYSALNKHGLGTSGKEDEEKIANIIQDLLTLAYLSQDTGIVEDFTDSTDNTIHENAFVEGTIGEIPIEPKELLFVNNTDYIEFEEITKSEYVTSILLNGRWS